MVQTCVPGCGIEYAEGAGPDLRCYRVNFDKIHRTLPAFKTRWTLRDGISQLRDAYKQYGLRIEEFQGEKYVRLKQIMALLEKKHVDSKLRWR
jgi:hypothetical protein